MTSVIRTHADFYPEYSDLEINPFDFEGTTRERFIKILSTRMPGDQARIVRGIVERFPLDQAAGPPTSPKRTGRDYYFVLWGALSPRLRCLERSRE